MKTVQREALKKLAEALFPLKEWFSADPTIRSFQPTLPLDWRPYANQQNLSINDLKVVEFLEVLLDHDEDDRKLAKRWRTVAKKPLDFHNALPGRKNWRKSRRREDGTPALDPNNATFGAAASGNFVLVEAGEPVTRGEFYQKCLEPFMAVVTKLGVQLVWVDLAAALLADKFAAPNNVPSWPTGIPKSSEFIKQFCKDVAYAALNFQSSAAARYPEAVAIELGEVRRPGNAFAVVSAEKAVAVLKQKLASKP